MSRSPHARWIIFALMVTIIIDVMGGGLVFPLFPHLFLDQNSVLMATSASLSSRHIYYAIAMGAWPLGIFFGTPYWGALSDQSGRKKMLAICLLGTAVTYVLGGLSLEAGSLWLFIASRFISGFFAGSFALAQAAIADVSLPEEKARNMSWITLALSIGLVVGPFTTSITSLPELSKWFSSASPFWFAAILACLNIASIMSLLPETFTKDNSTKVTFMKAVTSFTFIFTDKRLRVLAWISLAVQMGWGFYILTVPLFLAQRFRLSTHDIGLFFSVLGLTLMFMQLFVQPHIFKRFSLRACFIAGSVLCGSTFLLGFFVPTLIMHWIIMIVGSTGDLLSYSALMAICSNSVGSKEQGKVMGGAGALFGLAWVIIACMLAPIVNYDIVIPFLLAGAGFLLGAFLMGFYHPVQSTQQEEQ
ncbi:MAG: MFS transporter [Gammaproteobacteria bacterium]|nr:MFS transporter [Gammaproteobacteria bacterium]